MNNIEKLIDSYKLRLNKIVDLYNQTTDTDLKIVIEIQLDIYKQVINQLIILNSNE